MRIPTDRRFQAHQPDPQQARGTQQTDAAWGRRASEWLGRGNTLAVGGRELDSAGFRDVLQQPTQSGREQRMRDLLGAPQLDYRDFTRMMDDTIRAAPAAEGQRFAVTEAEARRHGVIDDRFDRQYGTRGPLELSATTTTARPEPVSRDTAALFSRADPAHAAELTQAYGDEPSVRALVDSRRFELMPPELQDRTLRALASHPAQRHVTGERADALSSLVGSPRFGELNPADQRRTLEIAEQTVTSRVDDLQTIVDRQRGGQSALLSPALGARQERMIDSLHALATAPLSERATSGAERHELLRGALEEIANPGRVTQSSGRTCGTAAIEYALANRQPAEYARLLSEMARDGRATTLRGDTLTAPEHATFARDGDSRSASERLFQSTLMNEAVEGASYDPRRDSRQSIIDTGTTGEGSARLMSMIYGREYSDYEHGFWTMDDPRHDDIMSRLRDAPESPTLVGMEWGGRDRQHALTFDRIGDDGRVYLRNPWGDVPQERYDGDYAHLQARREDGRGLISIPEDVFRERVRHIVIED